ncbi:MAG: hypothetical protein WD227_12030 [Vicinamibacterales bacterium]
MMISSTAASAVSNPEIVRERLSHTQSRTWSQSEMIGDWRLGIGDWIGDFGIADWIGDFGLGIGIKKLGIED